MMNGHAQADFGRLIVPVAKELFGEPNRHLSTKGNLRWGNKGSLSVDVEQGVWSDHEAKEGGGVLDLVMREVTRDKAGALRWLADRGHIEPTHVAGKPARAAGVPRSTFYDYCDEDGVVLYRVERRGKGESPPFRQHGPDGRGGFHSKRGCMDGVRRVPYRLPELGAADPSQIVFIAEGEKDADRLAGLGFVATTNSGGAGRFGEDLVGHFRGRRVAILEDNDKAGRDHASDVCRKVSPVAADVAIVRLPGLAEKGDVSDWLDGGGTVAGLREIADAAFATPEKPSDILPLLNPARWDEVPTPVREWALESWVPARQMTYLTGLGSVGKSLLMQQLCTMVALGLPFMGIATRQATAIYVTCEDDGDELHRRQKAICASLGVSLRDLDGKLHLVSLAGAIGNELAVFDGEGKMALTDAWQRLLATARTTGTGFLGLDNVAHLYGGNENSRHEVASFCNLLNRLALDVGAAVVLLGHPNKAGDAFSGSTAWENQVRSRLFMEVPKASDGAVLDPDARVLSRGKANYARNGERVEFRWHNWAFVGEADLPPNVIAELAAAAAQNVHEQRFLACLAERTAQRRAVSEKVSSTYAPKAFVGMAEAKGSTKRDLELAMERLFRSGRIERGELWKGPDRKPVYGLRETAGDRNADVQKTAEILAGDRAGDGAGDGAATAGDHMRDMGADTHPYTTYNPGAAQEAAAPEYDDDGRSDWTG